jgi:hypothetical protein
MSRFSFAARDRLRDTRPSSLRSPPHLSHHMTSVTKGMVNCSASSDEGGRPDFDPLSHEGRPSSSCTAAYNSSIFQEVLRRRVR